jgi:hypothetical protein
MNLVNPSSENLHTSRSGKLTRLASALLDAVYGPVRGSRDGRADCLAADMRTHLAELQRRLDINVDRREDQALMQALWFAIVNENCRRWLDGLEGRWPPAWPRVVDPSGPQNHQPPAREPD